MATLAATAALLATGCMSKGDAVAADVSPRGWNTPATMTYDNGDTLSQRMATLLLRHDHRMRTGKYMVEFRAPSGTAVMRDTFEIDVPDQRMPLVSMDWRQPYSSRMQLIEEGEWSFTVTPLQDTRGVWSLGMELSEPLDPLPYLPQDRRN